MDTGLNKICSLIQQIGHDLWKAEIYEVRVADQDENDEDVDDDEDDKNNDDNGIGTEKELRSDTADRIWSLDSNVR